MAVPAEIPVTTPDPELIVAMDIELLAHDMPPVVGSVNAVVDPVHSTITPAIGAGVALTVIDFNA